MASEMPPATAAQPKPLLAQQNKRLLVRLTAWGGIAALSLIVAVVASQTGAGSRRLQAALSGSEYTPDIPVAMAVPLPPSELLAFTRATQAIKRATDLTATKLAAVERNTAETRAETRRLAIQVNKLSADSFRVTGRIASIERQVDGMTGSIKRRAEEAAAAAVAKAMPGKPSHENAFGSSAPVISAPDTVLPRLSLLVPSAPRKAAPPADQSKPDVAATSAIRTEAKNTKTARKTEARVDPDALATEAVRRAEDLKAEVAVEAKTKNMPEANEQVALEPEPVAAPRAKPASKAAQPVTSKMANLAVPMTHRRVVRRAARPRSLLPSRGYGVDLGSADSITVVKAQWAAVKANFGPMLVGLRPTAVRDHRLLSGGSFRLVVGRLRSLKHAQRLCARFARQQVSCHPIEFDDGRVIWR